jgi:CelD/BcsL family acetyltransferase involved in cellulose biosynthesis
LEIRSKVSGAHLRRNLHIQEITTTEKLDALRPEWQKLWSNAPAATPFSSPDWLIPWWHHLGQGHLRLLALREADRLMAVMPCAELRATSHARWALLGEGHSDYLDGIFAEGFEQPALETVLDWLGQSGYDRFEITDLHERSRLRTARCPAGWQVQESLHNVCPVLSLPRAPAQLRLALPAHQLRNVRYYQTRARNLGEVQVERATQQNFPELFRKFFLLHRARWAERGQPGVLADPKLEQFHLDAASAFLEQNMLRLYVLYVAETLAGAIYTFTHRRCAYCYLAGFDPKYKPLSPGTLLIAHTIENALAEHCEAVDFLRGSEAYKYFWGARDEPTYRRTFLRGGKN